MKQEVYTGVIALVRSAINGESAVLPEGFVLSEALSFIGRHEIDGLVLEGAYLSGISRSEPGMKELFSNSGRQLLLYQRQQEALDKFLAALEEKKIPYLPLKGTVIRGLYPRPELRTMGDADILIPRQFYEQVVPIVREQGYEFGLETTHDFSWRSAGLYLELHHCLVPEDEDFYDYYADSWRFARPIPGVSRHEMSVEDTYLFLFTHFTKHCRCSGVGIRQMTDLWLYAKAHPDMDQAYLQQELEKLGLSAFYANVRETLRVWFGDGAESQMTRVITEHIANSGVFGFDKNSQLVHALKVMGTDTVKKPKWKLYLDQVFPPYDRMCYIFPVLKKWPVLLPFYYVWRLFRAVFLHNSTSMEKMKNLTRITDEELDEKKAMLDYIGLGTDWIEKKL